MDGKPPLRLSDTIRLVGRGADGEGQHYRIIEWQDRFTKKARLGVLPQSLIGTPQGWQYLQGLGITVLSGRKKRDLLADYLQSEGSNSAWAIAKKAGWHGSAYILPGGDIIAQEEQRIICHGDTSQKHAYQPKGSLADWQAHIARYAAGNSRLLLALGTAFAAPLLSLLNIEGGGFHLYGDSSDGKTTAAKVALSVWGAPDDLKTTWEGTGHGFSNLASSRNDGFLVLDEIGQASARVVQHTAYSVINGTAGRAFIGLLQTDPTTCQRAKDIMQAFTDSLPPLEGQARRVSKRFALAAAALELAQTITGIPAASAGIRQCFDDWHATHGGGKYEDTRITEQAEGFMQQHAHGSRFTDWSSARAWADHAGYKKPADDGTETEYWIIPAVFADEICQSYDTRKVCEVLHGIGWLKRNDKGGRFQFQRYRYGRFYVLIGASPPEPRA